MNRNRWHRITQICCLSALASVSVACCAAAPPEEIKEYWVDAVMNSFDADQSLDSYRGGGELGGSPGSTLGTSTPDSDISIQLSVAENRCYADVTIVDREAREKSSPKKHRFDLTSLRPQVLELGTAKDGRTYHLNLFPRVRTHRVRPKPFSEATDELYYLKFNSSRVILNDSDYVGPMGASDSIVFSMEISDVASLEFSLKHLKDAEAWGRLQNGRIILAHPDGTTIEIDNVTNGSDNRIVGGGPYVVWVRWNKPQVTTAQYRDQLARYREQIKNGTLAANENALAVIDKELERNSGPWVVSSGARLPGKDELSTNDLDTGKIGAGKTLAQ